MREALAKPMRDHKNWGHIVNCDIIINCGDYEISDGALGHAITTFHKDQIVWSRRQQIVGERVSGEITTFHLLHWQATKVVEKVVDCARSPISYSLILYVLGGISSFVQ